MRLTIVAPILAAALFGLAACGPAAPPTPAPTPAPESTQPEAPSLPAATARPADGPAPSATLSPADAWRASSSDRVPKLPPIDPTLISHGDRSLPAIALTFDACQTVDEPAGYDEAIIKILTDTGTPATLFLGGLWMQWHVAQTRALAANPLFELGNHSWGHPDFTKISPDAMSAEILQTQAIMANLAGRQPTLFRFPYDVYTDKALAVVGGHGLRAVGGDVITGDPDPRTSAQVIIETVTAQAHGGSIVFMHMNGRGWHTAEALPVIIKQLRARGYTFVTLSQLLGLAPPPTPVARKED
jgi:peptidoglycan/xylan/chitin deacetylase (PgdA/CDA1 family)